MIRAERDFWRNERGAAALEAAIVVPGFLVMILMIVQIGLMLAAQTMLDNAARDAARLIALGQVQTGGGATAFANQLCSDVSGPVSCASLQYNVVSGSSFTGLLTAITLDGNGNLASPQFNPGGPGADVCVEIVYNFPVMVPFLTDTSWTLVSSVAFQNEQYQ